MPLLQPGQAPPPDYYADNIDTLLGDVAVRSGDLLTPAEWRLIGGWRGAGASARRLLARLLTRKGPVFREDRLDYHEIPDIGETVSELCRLGLAIRYAPVPADRLLDTFTRPELALLFPAVRGRDKRTWINNCVSRHSDVDIRRRLAGRHPWITIADPDAFAVCSLLFFGSDRQDLSEFVLQDLGLRQYEAYETGLHTRPFPTRDDVDAYLRYRRLGRWLQANPDDTELAEAIRRRLWPLHGANVPCAAREGLVGSAGGVEQRQPDTEWAGRSQREPRFVPPASRSVQRLRDRLLLRLGQLHERRGEFDEALTTYALAHMHPARERRARLLQRLGDDTGQAALVAAMRAEPLSAAEEDYALRATDDSGARRRRESTWLETRTLAPDWQARQQVAGAAAESTEERGEKRGEEGGEDPEEAPETVAGVRRGAIERHAITLLEEGGANAWHLENHLPMGLAGLLYWNEIFAPVQGAFSHALQSGPRDLFWPDFARARKALLDERTRVLRDPDLLRAELQAVVDSRQGIANRLVHWGIWTPERVAALCAVRDIAALLAIAHATIVDLDRARTGFPDLTVIDSEGQIEFVEVKGPGDQLQPAQRTWLRRLEALGLPFRVLRFRS